MAFVAVIFLAAAAQAGVAEDLYLGASLDWNSRYIWRGITTGEGAVLQPSFWANLFGYNLMAWANYPLQDSAGRRGFDEINVFMQGTSPRRALVVVPGVNVYTYPRREEKERWTAEVVLTFYMPVGRLWLYWENNVDVVSYRGAYYAEFGLQAGRDIANNLYLDASIAQGYASAGFNEAYLDFAARALTYLTAHVGLEWRLAGLMSVTPHLEAVFTLDRELRREKGSAVRLNFGLTVTLGQT